MIDIFWMLLHSSQFQHLCLLKSSSKKFQHLAFIWKHKSCFFPFFILHYFTFSSEKSPDPCCWYRPGHSIGYQRKIEKSNFAFFLNMYLKCFAGTFCHAQNLKLGRVFTIEYLMIEPIINSIKTYIEMSLIWYSPFKKWTSWHNQNVAVWI